MNLKEQRRDHIKWLVYKSKYKVESLEILVSLQLLQQTTQSQRQDQRMHGSRQEGLCCSCIPTARSCTCLVRMDMAGMPRLLDV